MLKIRRPNVPLFLQSGSFFLGLDVLDDEPFYVPAKCFKEDACVRSDTDLMLLLRVVRFWGVFTLPVEICDYMLCHTPRSLDERLVCEFPELSILLSKVQHVKEAAAPDCISVAINSGLGVSTARSADRIAQSYFCLLLLYVTGDGILEVSWPMAILKAVMFLLLTGALVVINVHYITFEFTFLVHQE